MSGEPVFFEIGVDDPQRGKAFYGALFGWDFAPGAPRAEARRFGGRSRARR
jgi:predicted enzyme related to lactoylglutathione lyase